MDDSSEKKSNDLASRPTLVDQCERKLLEGKTRTEIKSWAKQAFDIDEKECVQLIDFIRATWAIEREPERYGVRRDEMRARYHFVYRRAMELDRLDTALKALDSLCKLDHLILPEINVNLNATANITSRTRERLTELFDKVNSLSAKPLGLLKNANPPGEKNGHTNGHSKKVMEVSPSDPDDDEDAS